MSDEPNNSEDEELLPDERPRRSRYRNLDDAVEVSPPTDSETPFQLQPSTAAEAPTRRKSRGKQGRDPVCSKYRMAWVMVFFDLPVGSPEERRDASNFRRDLIKDGYMMTSE